MDANIRAEMLKDEYITLQRLYEDIDGKGLTIKNWSITVALGIVGASVLNRDRNLLWLAFAASFVFWYVEAYWRGLSHFFAVRIQEIEAVLRDGTWEQAVPLQLYASWSEEYEKSKDQTFRYMRKRATLLPHALIPVLIAVLYFLL
jgi:hypothetical protein